VKSGPIQVGAVVAELPAAGPALADREVAQHLSYPATLVVRPEDAEGLII
jgi:hypothetical protein